MTLTTCNVTGNLVLPDGSAQLNAIAVFALSSVEIDGEVVIPREVRSSLGAAGALDVDLWPNARGTGTTHYALTVDLYADTNASRKVASIPQGLVAVPDTAGADIADILSPPGEAAVLPSILAGLIHAATLKATPAAADEIPLADSADSFGLKKTTFGAFATASQGAKADTAVQPARAVTAGTGLTGGGDLSVDRSVALDAGSIASLAKADTAVQPAALTSLAARVDGDRGVVNALSGAVSDYAKAAGGVVVDEYVSTTTGLPVADGNYIRTAKIAVAPGQSFVMTRSGFVAMDPGTAMVVVLDADESVVATYNLAGASETITPSALDASARYVYFVDRGASLTEFSVIDATRVLPDRVRGLNADLFAAPTIAVYVQLSDGAIMSSAAWETTRPLAVYEGQVLRYSGNVTALVAGIAGWDANGVYTGSLLSGTGANLAMQEVAVPAGVAYVTASARVAYPRAFMAGQYRPVAMPLVEWVAEIAKITGEDAAIYPRSLIPDTRFFISPDKPLSNARAYIRTGGTDTQVRISAMLDDGRLPFTVSAPYIRNAPQAANPATDFNIVCLGDSTTLSTGATGADWPNELSWQLTGIGDRLFPSLATFTSWGLSKLHFRGTEGVFTVKHEGRGGWSLGDYLVSASIGSINNAFWNPAGAGAFDFDYYLVNNGFDVASDATGVDVTGANCLVIIMLGRNDLSTEGTSAADAAVKLTTMIDAIHAGRSACKVLVCGMTPPPDGPVYYNYGSGSQTRFVSAAHQFRSSIIEYGTAFRAAVDALAAAGKPVKWLSLCAGFDARRGYATVAQPVAAYDPTVTETAYLEHVHANNIGNMQIVAQIKAAINRNWGQAW